MSQRTISAPFDIGLAIHPATPISACCMPAPAKPCEYVPPKDSGAAPAFPSMIPKQPDLTPPPPASANKALPLVY